MRGFELVWDDMPFLLDGALHTIEIAIIALFFATILGLMFGVFAISGNRVLTNITRVYVSIIRGTPLYVQVIFLYFAIFPLLFKGGLPAMVVGSLALSVNGGAYLSEVFKAGIQSIDKGQEEASRAIGFTNAQTFRLVILPQAVKRMIPAFLNQFSTTLKDTSLLAVISIVELMYSAQIKYSNNFEIFAYLFVISLMYWVMVTSMNMFAETVERRILK
ncbi:amino acid ABC transporter permease [Bacillus sp. AFS029533]|uniref:amino acid ABC transporter permease n=1 Tax=Bacillus sp. AFS029533 TaxID=2033494 RepID=UPI000BFB8E4F|nr:amino acid ABC transporter permease [Bacillus sp. AFS029533]PGZ91735.1 amino acid ABC transporter permease [Bacillus sp. AFS029533]